MEKVVIMPYVDDAVAILLVTGFQAAIYQLRKERKNIGALMGIDKEPKNKSIGSGTLHVYEEGSEVVREISFFANIAFYKFGQFECVNTDHFIKSMGLEFTFCEKDSSTTVSFPLGIKILKEALEEGVTTSLHF